MRFQHRGRLFWTLALLVAASIGGCRRAIVIVPAPDRSYTERDTLYGYHRGNRVTVSFRFDSVLRVDTVTRLDTLWRDGTRTLVRVDTVRVPTPATAPGMDVPRTTPTPTRVPTRPGAPSVDAPNHGTPPRVDTVIVTRRDTVVLTRRDTVVLTRRDTVTIGRTDTVRVAGRRTLFVPPGHYPPLGQCRVWIHNLPPGRQAEPTACSSLGAIPAGAFILFGGDAWDADYDWVAEAQRASVPPEIVALSRRRRP